MEIKKATEAVSRGVPTAMQLEAINAQAKAQLAPEQVYVFSLRLCDDQVDRDFERFDTAALPGLAKLFIGKTGVDTGIVLHIYTMSGTDQGIHTSRSQTDTAFLCLDFLGTANTHNNAPSKRCFA